MPVKGLEWDFFGGWDSNPRPCLSREMLKVLPKHIPSDVIMMVTITTVSSIMDEPDYAYIMKNLQKAYTSLGYSPDEPWDWDENYKKAKKRCPITIEEIDGFRLPSTSK